MNKKANCNGCSRFLRTSKLRKDKKDPKILLCKRCFKREYGDDIFNRNEVPIMPGGKEVIRKKKVFSMRPLFSKEEMIILGRKHGYDKFKTGREFDELSMLKRTVYENRKRKDAPIVKKEKITKKEFLEGLSNDI